jgi:hypothetical protein
MSPNGIPTPSPTASDLELEPFAGAAGLVGILVDDSDVRVDGVSVDPVAVEVEEPLDDARSCTGRRTICPTGI